LDFFKKSPKNLLTVLVQFYKIETVQLRETNLQIRNSLLDSEI